MLEKMTSKLGTNKGLPRSRIWIEGKRLIRSGFIAKQTEYVALFDDQTKLLILTPAEQGTVYPVRVRRVSGKGDKPIIDITGNQVVEFFNGFTAVNVYYYETFIVIKGAV